MPIYEYQCEKCHHHLEALQKIADKPLRECPECGKHSLKRLVSAPLFRLAGSGWYETDFKSDKENRRNLAGREEAPPAAENTKDATAKAEPKPETSETKTTVATPAPRTAASKPRAKPARKTSKAAPRKVARKR